MGSPLGRGGGGGYKTEFYTGSVEPFYIPSFFKKVPLSYDKWYPFHIYLVLTFAAPSNAENALS